MKIKRILMALAFFSLPLLFRGLWFYRGFQLNNNSVDSPDFSEFTVIQPPLSTLPASTPSTIGNGIKILFDQAHINKYTLAEIESLRNLLLQQGAEIIELRIKNDLAELLNKADAFVIITPADFYTTADLELIENFVQRGGRLLVIADPTRSYSEYDTEREISVILANEILEPFKISFRNDYVYNLTKNEGNYRNVFISPAVKNPLLNNISELVFYASHSLDTLTKVVLKGDENTLSSLDEQGDGLPVAALDESGNVLAIGDMTFMTTPYNMVADNYQLVINISRFLLLSSRSRTLADFPNLFTRPVSIRLDERIALDADLLSVIADLKHNFISDDLPLVILEREEPGFDQIILGIYPPNDQVKEYTDFFGINFDNGKYVPSQVTTPDVESELPPPALDDSLSDSSTFLIPGFGKIPSDGFGFAMLQNKLDQTTLILLADSQENIVKLLRLLVTGSLDLCLTIDFIAVCQQDAVYSQTLQEEFHLENGDDLAGEELLEELELTPTSTLTPRVPTETPTPTEIP